MVLISKSVAIFKELKIAFFNSYSSPLLPSLYTGPTAWIIYLHGRCPALLTTASPVFKDPFLLIHSLHSSYIL